MNHLELIDEEIKKWGKRFSDATDSGERQDTLQLLMDLNTERRDLRQKQNALPLEQQVFLNCIFIEIAQT